MKFTSVLGACLALFGAPASQAQAAGRTTTEDDYFGSVPVVLTASRLDQPLNEAPGAITVIDRETIRMSGARTLSEVLRLVPGYLAGGLNGANPNAVYHIPLDDYGSRNLVLIDGRSVYSSVYLGDTHRGMQDILQEDIERIEVLRGANSAAYGANAMFGVINVITRHSADTLGAEISATKGNQQVWDRRARIGVGDDKASLRLSAGEQRDSGYLNTFDDSRLSQLNLRADVKPGWADDLLLEAGMSRLTYQYGAPDEEFDPVHTAYSRDIYANSQWRHQLSATDEVQVSANYMEGWTRDATPYAKLPAVLLDYSSTNRRINLEAQRKASLSATVRTVVGVGYKAERAQSLPLYAQEGWLNQHEQRAFGTLEWRATPQWLVNGGLFVGQHSRAGTYNAPRLMVNWLPSAEHALRAGFSHSVRTPNLSEYDCDSRYYLDGRLIARDWACFGNVQPEKLRSQEIGYLGRWPNERVTLDVRAYRERMDTVIGSTSYQGDTYYYYTDPPTKTLRDYENKPGIELKGIESQWRWQPAQGTELWFNHSFEHLHWDIPNYQDKGERRPPKQAFTLAWFQHAANGWQFSVLTQRIGPMNWRDNRDPTPTIRRTDVRIAKALRLDNQRAEIAYTVQSLEGSYPFFLTSKNMAVGLRSFVQLKLEI